MLKVGDKAPDFTLNDKDGNKVSLKDFKGKKLVLYFYPKDNTSGCTKEACDFRDNLKSFSKLNAEVIGISADSEKSHTSFTEKYNLNFRLLSDPDKDAIQKYDVWKEKSMYGKKYMGIERTTYLIDEKGKIKKIFNKVKVDDHISEVLKEMEK
ncbi:MAG: thioredoxin-dependent thiol peroxidase [Ignavibacteriales bacterium]|nr:MAG: thioredoxin-dependent thiol peroxidase [Ignavibacteriales bacterium]